MRRAALLVAVLAFPLAAAQGPVQYGSELRMPLPDDVGNLAPGGATELPLVVYYNLTGPDCGAPLGVSKTAHLDLAIASDTTHVVATVSPTKADDVAGSCSFRFAGRVALQGNPDSTTAADATITITANASGGCFPSGCTVSPARKTSVLHARFVVPAEASVISPPARPWYAAPLAAENLPNTLQVGGAIVAAATFLVGVLVVQRRRSLVRKLLAEVEALGREHADRPAALRHALARLDAHAQALVARGRLAEDQYGIVARRIDAAQRHAQYGGAAGGTVGEVGGGA